MKETSLKPTKPPAPTVTAEEQPRQGDHRGGGDAVSVAPPAPPQPEVDSRQPTPPRAPAPPVNSVPWHAPPYDKLGRWAFYLQPPSDMGPGYHLASSSRETKVETLSDGRVRVRFTEDRIYERTPPTVSPPLCAWGRELPPLAPGEGLTMLQRVVSGIRSKPRKKNPISMDFLREFSKVHIEGPKEEQ